MSALVVNGWTIYVHPLLSAQLDVLEAAVTAAKAKHPNEWQTKNCSKRLRAIVKLATESIPANPDAPEFRQGDTLGSNYTHWRRAKFFQQYRLFFRFNGQGRVIVLAWVNDEDTKRAYDSANDAYAVFRKMLNKGNPPNAWDELLAAAKDAPLPQTLAPS